MELLVALLLLLLFFQALCLHLRDLVLQLPAAVGPDEVYKFIIADLMHRDWLNLTNRGRVVSFHLWWSNNLESNQS